jgi:hypothetical protein
MTAAMTFARTDLGSTIGMAQGGSPSPLLVNPAPAPYLTSEQFQKLVAGHGGVFCQFREVADPIFEAMLEGETKFTRRPNVSLRLPAQGNPLARVLVRPGWDRWKKEIRPGMTAETVIERFATTGIVSDKPLPHVEVIVEISDTGPRRTMWSYQHGEEALELMAETMADFIEDPEGVFARSSDRCCLCGRRLTDEVSRGRGIGPECIQKYHLVYSATKC